MYIETQSKGDLQMTTQEKMDMGFEMRPIPPLHIRSNDEQKIESRTKKSYGNKYLQNRRSISIEDSIAERLDNIQAKREIRTKGELFKYLADLEEKIDPMFKSVFKCKICNEEIKDIPKHINVNKFTHRDLCTDSSCKGYIVTSKEIALDSNGFVISNKTVANGATTTNDKNRAQIDTIEREMTQEEKHAILVENTRKFNLQREEEEKNNRNHI